MGSWAHRHRGHRPEAEPPELLGTVIAAPEADLGPAARAAGPGPDDTAPGAPGLPVWIITAQAWNPTWKQLTAAGARRRRWHPRAVAAMAVAALVIAGTFGGVALIVRPHAAAAGTNQFQPGREPVTSQGGAAGKSAAGGATFPGRVVHHHRRSHPHGASHGLSPVKPARPGRGHHRVGSGGARPGASARPTPVTNPSPTASPTPSAPSSPTPPAGGSGTGDPGGGGGGGGGILGGILGLL